jgi:putative transposase
VFFSDTDQLDHGFTSSYIGDSTIVLAGRSAGTRLTFGTGIVAYEPEQAAATAGGGSAVIAPAVALPESNADGSDGRGPVVQQCTRFLRYTTESY